MEYIRRNTFIVVERWVAGDHTLFNRLVAELKRKGHKFTYEQSFRGLKAYLTLKFQSPREAKRAEKWIDKSFEA